MKPRRHDPERIFDLDLVRCTENGALAAWKYFGKGDKNQVDYAASDAIRGMFSLIDCQGLVRIGEGRKDDALVSLPMKNSVRGKKVRFRLLLPWIPSMARRSLPKDFLVRFRY